MDKDKVVSLLNQIGCTVCDAEIQKMVNAKVISDGPCEPEETEIGMTIIVLTYLFNKINPLIKEIQKEITDD